MKNPFIYKLKSYNGIHYIYDVNTNQFIKVDTVIYDIIDNWNILSMEDIISKWRDKYSDKKIKEAINTIKKFIEKGYFSHHRPTRMWSPEFKNRFKDTFNSNISILILNITERCNIRCKYCSYSGTYYYERTHSERSMSYETIKKSLNYYLSIPVRVDRKCISFYGGEPLLDFKKIKNIVETVSQKFKNQCSFSMTTNGTLLTREISDFLIKHNFHLLVSLDGPQHVHDRYRVTQKGLPTFEKIAGNLKNIRKLAKEYYKKISFSVLLTPTSSPLELDEFFENFDLVNGHGLRISQVNYFDTEFLKIYGNYTQKYYQEIEELRKRYIKTMIAGKTPASFQKALFERLLVGIYKRQIGKLGDVAPANGICMPGVRRLFVSVKGMFYPCERIGESNAFCIGNVEKGIDFEKLKKLITTYIKGSEEECLNCWAVRLCGLCYVSVKKGHFINFKRKKEYCEIRRKILETAFKTYATIMEANPKAFDFVKNAKII